MFKKRMGLIISLALLATAFSLPAPGEDETGDFSSDSDNLYRQLEVFSTVLELARGHYVEEVTNQELIYGALEGMLSSLDPYSGFMEPEIYNEIQVETKGKFGGIGIEITMRNGILTVISPIEDTPASRIGVHPGDRIVKINGESTEGITLMEAVSQLRGKPDTDVEITVMRPGETKLLDFNITRAVIKIESVKDIQMLTDQIGYIRLVQFQSQSYGDFLSGLENLRDQGMKGIIVDLRYNPGGLLTAAISVAELFLPEDRVVVKTIGRNDRVDMEIKTSSNGEFSQLPVVVLINEGSASGSEIVAGALRDNGRAILVGAKSFGKGSVQTVMPMPDNSGVRLTTGHYYTASNRIIHEKGIKPDILVELTPEEQRNLITRKYRRLKDIAGSEMTNVSPEEKILRKALEKIFDEERSVQEQQVLEMVVDRFFADSPESESILPKPEEKKSEDEDLKDTDDEGEEEIEAALHDPQLQVAIDVMKALLLQESFKQGQD